MDMCDKMTESFYRMVTKLVDYHLLLITVKCHTSSTISSAIANMR